jgi:transcriptional regulator with GAF, ATPase, and Fis domain
MGTEAWFHNHGCDQAIASSILEDLALAGLRFSPYEARTSHAHGVLCFAEISEALLTWLRTIGCTTVGRVLALSTAASVLRGDDSWRLLHGGAAEVLAWSTGRAIANDIKARLDRWTAIDELVESRAVRELLVGHSPAWRSLIRRVVEAARFTRAPVLLTGESGTGKELLARLLHLLDGRALDQGTNRRELVTLDCTTIVRELSGSELFGHERGAFTGAVSARDGAFALADGGTLFLDEIGELPLHLQAQLLRAVQEKTYKRVGGNVWQTTDFRLVCATNRDLAEAATKGEFRLDLYYRIAGVVFRTPPLRDRREDILPLAHRFLKVFHSQEPPSEFDASVREYLLNRVYMGNVRDLRQLIQRIAHRHVGSGPITVGDIPEEDRPLEGERPRAWPDGLEKAISQAITLGAGLKEINQVTADTAIRVAVEAEDGNLQRAAKRLGVTDRALQLRKASRALRMLRVQSGPRKKRALVDPQAGSSPTQGSRKSSG